MKTRSLISGYDLPINALVVGATGGIGLAFSEALTANNQVNRLFVAARSAQSDPKLGTLSASNLGRVMVIDCDICDEASLARMAGIIRQQVPALHMVVNAAGALQGERLIAEKSVTQVSLASLQAAFAINSFAPVLLGKALMPLLRHREPAIFASLSARVGSIGDNRLGGWYSYRASKAAQNQLLKTLAIELARINPRSIVVPLHPGTTDTLLSKPFQSNVAPDKLFTPTFAAASLLTVISHLTPSDSGNFYAWDGQLIPW